MPGLALTLSFFQVSFGYVLTRFLDREKRLTAAEIFFASIVLGLLSSSLILLAFLLLLKSWPQALILLSAVMIGAGIYAIFRRIPDLDFGTLFNLVIPVLKSFTFWCLLVFLFLYIAVVASVFFVDKSGFPNVIFLGWGDSAYHLDMIGRLKAAHPFVLEQPILSGERLTYPFLINLLSALYERAGFTRLIAWHFPIFLLGISFFFLVFLLGKRIFSENKLAVALVALVFFGAGLGFIWFFEDTWIAWQEGGINQVLSTVADPPHRYTHLDNRTGGKLASFEAPHNIVWIVPAISFLSHQRSFLAGAALSAVIILAFLTYRGNSNLWRWGILWGMLPLSHTHTFLAVSLVALCWFFYDFRNYAAWIKAGLLGALLALPQVIYLMPKELFGSGSSSFFKPWFGWMTCTHRLDWFVCDPGVDGVDSNPLWFWTKNFGPVFWVWVLAIPVFYLMKNQDDCLSRVKPFLLPSLVLFVLPNVMLFQPWEFDNNKILFYWWIFASVISVYFFKPMLKKGRMVLFIFLSFLVLSLFSGLIDVVARITHFNEDHHGYYGRDEAEVAEWIRENTNPNDAFLTGSQPGQFIPMLTGRPIYLGYAGWLWPQGKSDLVGQRRSRALSFLALGEASLICADGIKYILWDEELLRTYPSVNRGMVSSATDVVFRHGPDSKKEILELRCQTY